MGSREPKGHGRLRGRRRILQRVSDDAIADVGTGPLGVHRRQIGAGGVESFDLLPRRRVGAIDGVTQNLLFVARQRANRIEGREVQQFVVTHHDAPPVSASADRNA